MDKMTCEEYVVNRVLALENLAVQYKEERRVLDTMYSEACKIIDGLKDDIAFIAQFCTVNDAHTQKDGVKFITMDNVWNTYDKEDYIRLERILGFSKPTDATDATVESDSEVAENG